MDRGLGGIESGIPMFNTCILFRAPILTDFIKSPCSSRSMHSRVEDSGVEQFMSADPQIHRRHSLSRFLNLHLPILPQQSGHLFSQPVTPQDSLRLIRPHDGCSHRSAENGLGMVQQENMCRIPHRNVQRARDHCPNGCEMPPDRGLSICHIQGGSLRQRCLLQLRRQGRQYLLFLGASLEGVAKSTLPDREQSSTLRRRRPSRHVA